VNLKSALARPGHNQSYARPRNHYADDRLQGYSRRTLTTAWKSEISKADDQSLAVPLDIKILSSVCSSRRRNDTADPQESFVVLAAQRQVSEWSGRAGRELTENSSAITDLDPVIRVGQLCLTYQPLSRAWR